MPLPRPNLQNTLALAISHHQAGRLDQAAQLYQEIIARDPQHADALRLLGVIAHVSGKHELAVDLLRQAIAVNPRIAEYHSNLGLALHALAQYDQAIASFQTALQLKPNLAEAHYNLGNTLKAHGQFDHAAACYHMALELQPNYPEALNNLGNALKDQGQMPQAVATFQAALKLAPPPPPALASDILNNLGNALQSNNQLREAVDTYQAALRLQPDDPQTLNNLGSALHALRQYPPAIACYQAALRLQPRYAEAHFNLANTLKDLRYFPEATASYRTALDAKPNYPEAHNNLGNTYKEQKQLDRAAHAYRAALALKPNFAEAHNNLGTVLKDQGHTDDAAASFRQAMRHKPDYAEALSNLGNVYKDQGLLDEAIAAFRQATAWRPADVVFHNNLIYTLHFDPNYDPHALAAELAQWNVRHAQPWSRFIQPLDNNRDPAAGTGNGARPLRIGFVSPDFCGHPIGRFLLPLFSAHDPASCKFFCYSDVLPPGDDTTAKFRAHTDRWNDTRDLTSKELAALIRWDQVDILLDLTMHMEGSRLLTFAQKPAPIQITYLAYPTSTGMETIDYRLTDAALEGNSNAGILPASSIADQRNADIQFPIPNSQFPPSPSPFTERPLLLNTYWCYPAPDNAPEVSPLPAVAAGHITFACLNNFAKVSPQSLNTWIQILQALPNSQLFLHASPGSHRDRLLSRLAAANINPARCTFFGFLPFDEYLALHHRIDIALDPFPYAGGTTSCDALFMGVPLVTLAGPNPLSRGGVSLLTQLQLPDLIATSRQDYIPKAVTLAQDLPRLEHLRSTLRPRMESSPLMDASAFAQDFQSLMRQAWRQWAQP